MLTGCSFTCQSLNIIGSGAALIHHQYMPELGAPGMEARKAMLGTW